MIVVDGHLVTQEQREASEVVACYDAANGKEIWVHSDAVRFEESLSGPARAAHPHSPGAASSRSAAKGISTASTRRRASRSGRTTWSPKRTPPCRNGVFLFRRWWSMAR